MKLVTTRGLTIEISATVSEAVADAFAKQKALPEEGFWFGLRVEFRLER